MTPKKAPARLPLTSSILSQGQRVVTSIVDDGRVMWPCLALSYFLLCRASELWANANGKVHPEFCLTRNCLTFPRGQGQVAFENRSSTNTTVVQVRFLASKNDQKRAGRTITRTRVPGEKKVGGEPAGAFEALPELLRVHPQLPGEAPVNREAHATDWRGSLIQKRQTRRGCCEAAAEIRLSTRCTPEESGGNPVGGARGVRATNPVRRQMEVARVRDLRAGGRGRRRVGLRRPRQDRVVRFRLPIWCERYIAPQGKERGISFFELA